MVASATTLHPFDTAPPALGRLEPALLKLALALTYEDFADALEGFCEAAVPHDSRLMGIGCADYRECDYNWLVRRAHNAPAPGAEFVDEDLRHHLGAADTERVSNTPGIPVWHRKNSFPAFGARNEAEFCKTEFFRRVAEPEGWQSNLCVPLWIDGNIHSLFWIKRAQGRPPFSDAEVRLMEHYQPWLLAALKHVRLLEENRAHNKDISAALFDIPVASFLLDWDLRVLQRNAAADDACAAWRHGPKAARATKPPFLCAGRVPAEIAAACHEMKTRWLASYHASLFARPTTVSAEVPCHNQRVKIPHPLHPQLEATITLLRPNALRQAHPSFLVRINKTETPAAPAQERHVRLLAQLTQAEREIVPLVARGMSDKEIAAALCKSVPTVKNQLRSAYEKLRIPNRARLMAALK